jgi:hypothetical protein
MSLIKDVFGDPNLMSKNELKEALELIGIAVTMSGAARDTLLQLRDKGPIWDGDLISKAGRTELIDNGGAVQCVVKGQQGYQACTYQGWVLAKLIEAGLTIQEKKSEVSTATIRPLSP